MKRVCDCVLGVNPTYRMSKLTLTEKLTNQLFFDRMFNMLKEGGVWEGDHGSMRKVGTMWIADLPTYIYLKQTVPKKYVSNRVLLFMDATKAGLVGTN